MVRDDRQLELYQWGAAAFGKAHVSSSEQRAVRFLEEAIELYQACGADLGMAHKLLDYVFSRPVGDLKSEFGGVGVTVLMLAEACGMSAEACEVEETERVLKLGPDHFTKRNAEKNEAGFDTTGAYRGEVVAGVDCRTCDNGRQRCFTHRSTCPKRNA